MHFETAKQAAQVGKDRVKNRASLQSLDAWCR